MKWKLVIKDYGKIKEAVIHDSSLRLIVGHNNSGKSYLMTLLWGLEKIHHDFDYLKEDINLATWLKEDQLDEINNGKKCELFIKDYTEDINIYINLQLQKHIKNLISKLFNFEGISIGGISLIIEFSGEEKLVIDKDEMENVFNFRVISRKQSIPMRNMSGKNKYVQRLNFLGAVVNVLYDTIFNGDMLIGKSVYLPAARTGFMLTKDVINKNSRRIAFGNEENRFEPFTMPIMDFLDVMEDIGSTINSEDSKYSMICMMIEKRMLQGKLCVSDNPNKSLLFTPAGTKESINLPLRTTSAVVTEVSPLYLLLKFYKYTDVIKTIYYEEPEMCLHPQLQQIMARVLIQLANTNMNLTATTHSDIIIQHINNMIRLGKSQNKELMEKYGYLEEDLLKEADVSMYQFKENEDGTTTLEELVCGAYGFEVPTFNNALDDMLEEVYELQGEDE